VTREIRRIAVAGLGDAGFTLHLPALAGLSGIAVAGAADPDSARRQRASAKFGVPVFDDLGALLAQTHPDVVVIGTPPHTHALSCRLALAAGADVICEKPFASSLHEADQVLEAAASASRRVAVNHQFREMPIFRALLEAATPGGEQAVRFAQVWQLMDLPPGVEEGWRGSMAHRTLFEAGVHLVDFVMALFGEEPKSVLSSVWAGSAGTAVDAIVLATLEFSNGRLAQIVQNRLCKGPRQYFEVRADTSGGSLRASFGGRSRLTAGLYRSLKPHVRFEHGLSGLAWREIGTKRRVLARNPNNPLVAATRTVFEKTIDAFQTGAEPPTSGPRARAILKVIAACYHAAASGQRVRLDVAEPHELTSLRMG
jgi:predicted dehydrogenase